MVDIRRARSGVADDLSQDERTRLTAGLMRVGDSVGQGHTKQRTRSSRPCGSVAPVWWDDCAPDLAGTGRTTPLCRWLRWIGQRRKPRFPFTASRKTARSWTESFVNELQRDW